MQGFGIKGMGDSHDQLIGHDWGPGWWGRGDIGGQKEDNKGMLLESVSPHSRTHSRHIVGAQKILTGPLVGMWGRTGRGGMDKEELNVVAARKEVLSILADQFGNKIKSFGQ